MGQKNEISFCSYPKLLFVWPIIAMGYIFLFVPPEGAVNHVVGWVYVFTIFTVILCLGVDVERNYTVFWLVAFVAVFFIAKWLADARGITFFDDLLSWVAAKEVRYSKSAGLVVSLLLTPPYITMLVWARLIHRWRVTNNEFEHYSFGRSDDSLARGAKRVRSTYPDIFELLICGAGTLIVYSATGRTELRRVHNVPLLPWKRRKINEILESKQVRFDDTQAEAEVAAEEMEDQEIDQDAAGDDDGYTIDDTTDDADPEGHGAIGNERL